MSKKPTSTSVDRALNILELVARPGASTEAQPGGLSNADISRKLNIPKSSLSYLLQTLEDRGYLQRNLHGLYRLGSRLAELSHGATPRNDLHRAGHTVLEQLAERTGFAAHIAIMEGPQAVYVDKAETESFLKVNTWIGRRLPLHCTAVGKALLAHRPEAEIRRILGPDPLGASTARSLTSLQAVLEDLATVRAQGWALDDQESDNAVRCVAAPIFDTPPASEAAHHPLEDTANGPVRAALGLTGPLAQMTPEQVQEQAQAVIKAARLISRQLGATP